MGTIRTFIILLMMAGVSLTVFGEVVTFENGDLESAVRIALGKPSGDITDTEMATISELEVGDLAMGTSAALSLNGIEYCTHLETLTCRFDYSSTNEQLNARLAEISVVSSMRSLTLTGAEAVGGCSLRVYSVLGTAVDISPLASLSNLEYLMLFVAATTLSPLESLSALDTLISSVSTTSEINEIGALTQVEELKLPYFIWETPEQLAPLSGMTSLRDLMIEWVKPTLDAKSFPVISQVETLQVNMAGNLSNPYDPLMSVDFVSAFPGLHELILGRVCWDENHCLFGDYSAIGALSNLERLTFHRPPVVDLSFIAELDQLGELLFLEGDDSQFEAGGQDFAPLVSLLTELPRPFTLVAEDNSLILSEAACSEQLPLLAQMPYVSLSTDHAECLSGTAPEIVFTASIGTPEAYPGLHEAGQDIVLTAGFVQSPAKEQFVYQWYKDGDELTGEVSSTLLIENAEESDSGEYACTVAWSGGTATTSPVALRVVPAGSVPTTGYVALAVLLGSLVVLYWRRFARTRNGQ